MGVTDTDLLVHLTDRHTKGSGDPEASLLRDAAYDGVLD